MGQRRVRRLAGPALLAAALASAAGAGAALAAGPAYPQLSVSPVVARVGEVVIADGSATGGEPLYWSFDWGDGQKIGPERTPRQGHVYHAAGKFTIRMEVIASDESTSEAKAEVTVDNPPAAALAVTPTGRRTVQADASGSTDTDPFPIASYRFDWGDGTSTGPQPSPAATHTYANGLPRDVLVTVADTAGLTGQTSRRVELPPDQSDVSVELTVSPAAGVVGDPITYRARVRNAGPDPAAGATLTLALPAAVALTSATVPGGSCAAGPPVTCQLGTLGAGEDRVVTVLGKVERTGRIDAAATTASTVPDANPADNKDTVAGAADLLPPPEQGKSVNAAVRQGSVSCGKSGGTLAPVSEPVQLPVGTVCDATKGQITVTSVGPGGRLQSAWFYAGRFAIGQAGVFTDLRLSGGNFKVCKARRPSVVSKAKPKPKVVRRLWGKGKGRFRTKGRYASAAVRGTWWLVEDRCDGTRVLVKQGVVAVFDPERKQTRIVRAGKSVVISP